MYTLFILLLMAAGILLGWVFLSKSPDGFLRRLAGHVQAVGTSVLLASMGIWLGGNEDFWSNLSETGIHGLLFAAITVTGSIIVVSILCRFAFGGRGKEKHL